MCPLARLLPCLVAVAGLAGCRDERPAPPAPVAPRPPETVAPSAFVDPGAVPRPAPRVAEAAVPDEGPLDASTHRTGEAALRFSGVLPRVLSHYPELQARHARVDEAVAMQSLAVAGFLPRLQARMGWDRTDSPVGVFMDKLQQRTFQQEDFQVDALNHPKSREDFHGALRLEFPLFDAFQTIASSRTARHALSSARDRERHGRAEAALLAVESWLQVGRADRCEAMARESLARARRDLGEAESLREQGLVLGADFFSARVAAAALEQRLNECVAARAVARAALNVLQGDSATREYSVASAPPSGAPDPRPAREWIEEALANRADLVAARSVVEAQRSEVGRMKGRLLPNVSLFAEGADHTRAFEHHGSEYAVGAQVNVDLFDPAYGARVRAAEARLRQAEQEEAALRDAVATSVTAAAAHLEATHRNLAVLQAAARDGREATRLVRGLARDGRKSVADLLASRALQLEVERALAEARAEATAARARLLFLAGALEGTVLDDLVRRLDPAP